MQINRPFFFLMLLSLLTASSGYSQVFQPQRLNGESLHSDTMLTHDFDRDGDLDIVVAQSGESIAVLLNQGNGQFTNREIVRDQALTHIVGIYLCDCDNDGNTDYMFVDRSAQLVWFQRQADDSFIKWTIASGTAYSPGAVADFDGDGNTDIAVIDTTSAGNTPLTQLQVHFNDGFFNFTKMDLDAREFGFLLVDAADLDNDGDVDIVVGSGRNPQIFSNNGDGTFAEGRPFLGPVFLEAWVTIADVDVDGAPDILSFQSLNAFTSDLVIFNGAQNYARTPIEAGNNSHGDYIAVADIDNNGLPDIIRYRHEDRLGKLGILFQDMPLVFRLEELDRIPSYSGQTTLTVGDLDGDMDLDIIHLDATGNRDLFWYENIGGRLYRHMIRGEIRGAHRPNMTDLDQDGDLDILLAAGHTRHVLGENEHELLWYENRGEAGTVDWRIDDDIAAPADVNAGDLNGDGVLDVVAASREGGDLFWYQRNGLDWERFLIEDNANEPRGFTLADMNADGHLDITMTSWGDHKIFWYLNDGMGTFARRVIDPNLLNPLDVEVADLNGDGHPDVIAIATDPANSVAVYLNDGMQRFARQIVHSGQSATDIAVADWDGDGAMDFIASFGDRCGGTGDRKNFALFHNDGNGNFNVSTAISGCPYIDAFAITELDGDGILDVVAADSFSSSLRRGSIQNGTLTELQDLTDPQDNAIRLGDEAGGIDVGDFNGDGILDIILTARAWLSVVNDDVLLLVGE